MNPPLVSVLLVSWNTRDETRRCLDSLRATTGAGLRYEVVAVDNGSRDGSAEMLAADPDVRLTRNRHNVGFAAAVNQAYRQSSGELVLLLNSDVVAHPGALETMVGFLRERPDAAGVSPLYLNPDGTFQQHYVQLPSFTATIALVTALRRIPVFRRALHTFQMRGQDFSRPRQLASGSCMLLRRAVLPADRVFDERFPLYWNDAMLARTLQAAGHRLWMIPDAVVTHTRGASCRLLGPAVRFRHLLGSLVCYLRLTEPRHRLILFRAVLIVDHVVKRIFGRHVTLGWGDLRAALRGDVGPLPDGDIRDWLVLSSADAWANTGRHSTALVGALAADRRVLFVDPPARFSRWRSTIRQVGDSVWLASVPTVLPLGRLLPPVDWLNRRVAAAVLRRWLDQRPGARVLRVDEGGLRLGGRLGEDATVAATPEAPTLEPSRG
ncbi:glycosyltransferase family 2 protein [Micromonospora sp. NBC_01699]|uniref:glycosyltransferase family 2 protein n=1 Tax=Micromonospora sp. NBC_01699 TaxID=2975984 RepID=UPI002E2F9423|nr:glycosyltransferase family 2 protein [Micromonospora sp. NBC_01699]